MSDALHRWSAVRMRRALAARELSATEVLDAHLRQIEAVNPQVNAIVTLAADEALQTARRLDASPEPVGPLHGIPVAIKDLMDTAGMRTTYGSPIYKDHVPSEDVLLVRRLREAGAIVVGKTNVPEFGAGSHTFNEIFGPTRNPWNLERSAGGSSGGAAAALAAAMVPIADGSDHGGSLRNPAAFCGVVGFRPSPGRVPALRQADPWDPHSVLGPMARTVPDAALLMSVIGGADPRAPLSGTESARAFAELPEADLRGVRVAWDESIGGLPIESAIVDALQTAKRTLIDLGAEVVDVEIDFTGADEVFQTFRSLGALTGHAEHEREHPDLLKPEIHDELRWARELTAHDIARARDLRAVIWQRMTGLAQTYDLFALPVTQVVPFDVKIRWPQQVCGIPMDRYYTWMRSCSRLTATTLPAISIPAGFTADGLPVGLQLVGGPAGDRQLLSRAAALEAALALPTLSPLAG